MFPWTRLEQNNGIRKSFSKSKGCRTEARKCFRLGNLLWGENVSNTLAVFSELVLWKEEKLSSLVVQSILPYFGRNKSRYLSQHSSGKRNFSKLGLELVRTQFGKHTPTVSGALAWDLEDSDIGWSFCVIHILDFVLFASLVSSCCNAAAEAIAAHSPFAVPMGGYGGLLPVCIVEQLLLLCLRPAYFFPLSAACYINHGAGIYL